MSLGDHGRDPVAAMTCTEEVRYRSLPARNMQKIDRIPHGEEEKEVLERSDRSSHKVVPRCIALLPRFLPARSWYSHYRLLPEGTGWN